MSVTFERETCPNCQTKFAESDASGELVFCRSCSWSGLKSPMKRKRQKAFRQGMMIAAGLLATAAISTYSTLRSSWGEFTNERITFVWKRATGGLTTQDWKQMGSICNTTGDWRCAAEAFGEVASRDPGDVIAAANHAMAQTRLGAHKEAREEFEKVLKSGGMTYDVMGFYGISLENTGAKDQAMTVYQQALRLNPNLIDVADRLAGLLIESNQIAAAEELLNDFLDRSPRSADYLAPRKAAIQAIKGE